MLAGANFIRDQFAAFAWRIDRDEQPLDVQEIQRLLNPNSIDVTLSDHVLRPESYGVVDVYDPASISWEPHDISKTGLLLKPGEFVLASAAEAIDCKYDVQGNPWVQMYDGRSTLARLGLQSHMTAGFGDWGFSGAFTLELHNCLPYALRLPAGIRVGQVYFQRVVDPTAYCGGYSGADHRNGPRPPVIGPDRF